MLWPFSTRLAKREEPIRICAIGDIHGCSSLLAELLTRIEEDLRGRPAMSTRLIVLGDFIDRGPKSALVVKTLMRWAGHAGVVVLKGNHEAAMLEALDGDAAAMEDWLSFGGDATLRSFGVTIDDESLADLRALTRTARKAVTKPVIDWLRERPVFHREGGYFFVHAGVRPAVPLSKQAPDDLLWIRNEFIESDADHGAIVVHGHSIADEVTFAPNRIGVDTGAYRTGRLSAVLLEGDRRWTVTTAAAGGAAQ